MSKGVAGFMAALKAQALFGDSELFGQIRRLCADLQYSTEDGKFAFDDYFKALVEAIDAIPKLELENDVAPARRPPTPSSSPRAPSRSSTSATASSDA